jgi:hypothetical protein
MRSEVGIVDEAKDKSVFQILFAEGPKARQEEALLEAPP